MQVAFDEAQLAAHTPLVPLWSFWVCLEHARINPDLTSIKANPQ